MYKIMHNLDKLDKCNHFQIINNQFREKWAGLPYSPPNEIDIESYFIRLVSAREERICR